ncbi:NAD(P)-dependent oxidoreductase [Desulfuromonas versatilis]|uniref:NAD(P)-dependent oxidoreductase n=1 Tax=Desulfuromonas versatilis TaxID=2802975 RepID=A0ABM8HR81_9BACT|nr:SDR family oxidoreductase [Desulfuromonas versatilis]BCR05579.1 NAD(P)-dependent oxidoreductase [Desulfuromonas versatilis]
MSAENNAKPILVLGATGYIGGRLVPRLLEAGYRVRAAARNPAKLRSRAWSGHPQLELVQADVLDLHSLAEAAAGCGAAYYLVHSMNPRVTDFARTDREAAQNMVTAAATAGLERIIYLGGLGQDDPSLSHHLRSRSEVGRILQAGGVPATILRAAMIIGSGSASFEILRYLVDRLPVMITPRWIDTPCQPIGVRNVLQYLVGCLECPETIGGTFDIGQPEVVSYRRLMEIYAEEAGLHRRWIIPVPVLTPRLSAYWIHLVTPVPAAIAMPLAEGLRNPVICTDTRIRELIPQGLFDCRKAIRLALVRLRQQQVESSWTDAGVVPPAEWSFSEDPRWAGGTVYRDGRRVMLEAPIDEVWQAVAAIGGRTGWYYGNWLWQLRGWIDRLLGGVGLGRGRRDASELRPGDALDFWRVLAIEKPHRLLLVAEMKLPGEAVLEFRLGETKPGCTDLKQIARFLPRGLWGILYWVAVYPLHGVVFNGMLRGIAERVNGRILQGPERLPADRRTAPR